MLIYLYLFYRKENKNMAVNASESIQTTRDLAHLEKNSTDLVSSRAAYHDLDEFEKSIHNSFSMVSYFL